MKVKGIISVVLFVSLFVFVVSSPVSILSGMNCLCGGCCGGCPGDCDFSLGFPLPYYYSGYNFGLDSMAQEHEELDIDPMVKHFSILGFIIDAGILVGFLFLIHKFLWKKKNA